MNAYDSDSNIDSEFGFGYDCENWPDISSAFDSGGFVNEYGNYYQHGCGCDHEHGFEPGLEYDYAREHENYLDCDNENDYALNKK